MRDISARELKGHKILAVERFWDNTRWMIEFSVLRPSTAYGSPGEEIRLFLTEDGYQAALQSQQRREIKIKRSPINDELLAAVGKLTAEYGRIGGNLNQIARTLNEWHSPYPQLAGEVRAAVSDLAALKFEVLQKVGDAVGNIQTYQL